MKEGLLIGVVGGILLSSLLPDLPTAIDYCRNRPDLAGPTLWVYGLVIAFVVLVVAEGS